MCIGTGRVHTCHVHMCRSENNFRESVPYFHPVVQGLKVTDLGIG